MGWKFHAVTILMILVAAALALIVGICAAKLFS